MSTTKNKRHYLWILIAYGSLIMAMLYLSDVIASLDLPVWVRLAMWITALIAYFCSIITMDTNWYGRITARLVGYRIVPAAQRNDTAPDV